MLNLFISDGYYRNYNKIVKITGDRWVGVTHHDEIHFPACCTSAIEVGDASSFFIQEEGLKVATQAEFVEAIKAVHSQIDKYL